MRAFRLSSNLHPATTLTGEGARVAGGRWNHQGIAVVYCSESRSLATIEYLVNLAPSMAPRDLVLVALELPDTLVEIVDRAAFPSNWRTYPAPETLKDIGTAWVRKSTSAALLVPSAVIPEEHNLLLNVDHIDFGRIAFGPPSGFTFARPLESLR